MALIEHCRQRQKATAVYRIKNYNGFDTLFILKGDNCHDCDNRFYNTVAFDIWGTRSPETGANPVDKKIQYRYDELIRTGQAVLVSDQALNYRNTKGGMVGVGEYTLTAKKDTAAVFNKILHPPKKYKLFDSLRNTIKPKRLVKH